MKDVLHIVKLLKRQAESALALATRRKSDALVNIESIKDNIVEMGKTKSSRNDGLVYEHWCAHQRYTLGEIKNALPMLDEDIITAFRNLENVQAKLTAAQGLADKQNREETLKMEASEEDAMLELSLLRRVQK